jgi:acetyl esterase
VNTIFVRPDVQSFLDELAANPRPPFTDELIALIQKMSSESMGGLDLPVGDLATIETMEMPSPNGPIALCLFDARADRVPGPVIVFYHGGGFVAGSISTHAGLAATLARELDLPVISVEYRLAPEYKWPAAPDDAEAAARWIAEHGGVGSRKSTGLILCGDSAGGNLAIVVALALRDTPAPLPVGLVWPIYPAVDLVGDQAGAYESGRQFSEGYGLSPADGSYFNRAYAPAHDDWRAVPLLADLAGLPPIFIVTAALDPLKDQGRAFAAKAISAGVNVTYREYHGTIHGFATYRAAIPSAELDTRDMIATAAAIIRRTPAVQA